MDKRGAATVGVILIMVASGIIGGEMAMNKDVNQQSVMAKQFDYISGAQTTRTTRTRRFEPVVPERQFGVAGPPTTRKGPGTSGVYVFLEKPPQCDDNKINGFETDLDCGGKDCPGCGQGKVCLLDSDCGTFNCLNNICGPPLCPQAFPKANGV